MKLGSLRNIPRIGDITSTLVRHGLAHVAEMLGLPIMDKLKHAMRGGQEADDVHHMSAAARLRNVLQDLGPTFIKLGQLLSTRPDLVGREFVEEFGKLQDECPPMPPQVVERVLRDEFGGPPDEIFLRFDPTPIAAASIGQVHKAVLRDGTVVALKVKREGIESTIRADMEILFLLASFLRENDLPGLTLDPVAMVEELARSIEFELDYVREKLNAKAFARNFADDPTVHVPAVYEEFCTERVLCLEFVDGVRVDRLSKGRHDPVRIARRGVDAVLKQIFVHGCFHADPHPGNVFVLDGDVICFLDFGMIGRISSSMRERLCALLVALVSRDYEAISSQLAALSETPVDVDPVLLSSALMDVMDPYYGVELSNVNVGRLFYSLMSVLAGYHVRFPSSYVLMMKAMITIESFGRGLDPDLDFIAHVQPFVKRMVAFRFSPDRLKADMLRMGSELAFVMQGTPRKAALLLDKASRGEFSMRVESAELGRLPQGLEESSNRLAVALVTGALIIGSSILVGGGRASAFPSHLAFILFVVAGLMGVWLVFSVLRSGRL